MTYRVSHLPDTTTITSSKSCNNYVYYNYFIIAELAIFDMQSIQVMYRSVKSLKISIHPSQISPNIFIIQKYTIEVYTYFQYINNILVPSK